MRAIVGGDFEPQRTGVCGRSGRAVAARGVHWGASSTWVHYSSCRILPLPLVNLRHTACPDRSPKDRECVLAAVRMSRARVTGLFDL